MEKLKISEIWIYPVKSLGGIRMSYSRVFPKGLEYDRRWMLIEDTGKFMTQRMYPEMSLFKAKYHSGSFSIHYNNESIQLPFTSIDSSLTAQIWNDEVTVHEVSREHSVWFSERLKQECKLVSFPENNPRPVDRNYAVNNDQVSLADAYPLLIIGQSSLDDLNQRLTVPVPMNRFRPNIVFTDGEPYIEDGWKYFRAGKNRFAAVKPCSRCVLTTIDQESGAKGYEPLSTLSVYRMKDNKVYFGQNVIPLNYHEITEGDEIVPE
ncbi:MAG: MOSC domain-containing protein [Chitinophagaceae bacterium]|nr:MOSC domain-containing protein [Chitinophagaceae bacterium]